MVVLYRSFLSCFLSLVLVLTGAPFHLMPKQAQAQSQSDVASADEEMQKSLEQLKESFASDDTTDSHLDPFLITRQMVLDDRSSRVTAVEEQRAIEDFEDRIQYLESSIQSLKQLEAQVQQRLSELTVADDDKLNELELIKADIISRRRLVELELADTRKFDPRQGSALPVDHMVDKDLKTRHYWGNRMKLVLEANEEVIGEVAQKDFTQSLSPRFNKEALDFYNQDADVRFTITDRRGTPLHQFLNPISGVTFFGHYLVFVEKSESQTAEKSLPVRFIDLRYAKANIGNAPLPVFTLPLKLDSEDTSLSHENGYLKVGGQRLSYQQFEMLSQVHQVIFNVNVALVDPNAHDNARPLIKEVLEFFQVSMQAQEKSFQTELEKSINATEFLNGITGALNTRKNVDPEEARELIQQALKDGKLTDQEFAQISHALDADNSLRFSNLAVANGRRLMTRIRLMMQYLVQPRVEGAPKLLNAMAMLVAPKTADERGRAFALARNGLTYKMAKYGAAMGGVLLAGDMLPEPYKINIYKSLDLISAVNQHFQGYLQHISYGKAYVDISKDAFITSTTGWTYFIQSYFADGNWPKFLYGLGQVLLVPLKLFASIHFTVNSYKMFRETLKIRRLSGSQIGFLKAFKEAAKGDNKAYWDSLSEAEKKSSGSDVSLMSDDDVRLLDEHILRLREGRQGIESVERDLRLGRYGSQGVLKTQINTVSTMSSGLKSQLRSYAQTTAGFLKYNKFSKKVGEAYQKVATKLGLEGEDTVRKALANSFLSYSALRSTFKTNALIWNYLFMTRSYMTAPHKLFVFTIYPNYFKAAVTTVKGKQHFPSTYNGGLETWPQKLQRIISSSGMNEKLSKVPVLGNLLISEEALKNLRSFESEVAKLEIAAIEIAKTKAQMALIENIKDPERLLEIFDSTQRPGDVSTGVRNLNDKKLKKLNKKEKVFYRAYFTRSFDLIMQRMLADITSTELSTEMDPVTFAKKFRSEIVKGDLTDFALNAGQIKALKDQLETQLNFEQVRDWAEQVSVNGSNILTRANLALRHSLLQSMHPGNAQVRRFLTVREKVEEPRAMERAMRMEVTSMLSGIPISILSTLALYAGVQTGMLMPFDPVGMNTETHFNYMSRYLFYNGFIPGLILGMLANTWMKLQEDNRIDSIGGFDQAIKHSDGKRGFWRYYLKNVFKNPNNKWKDNHIYYLKLIVANIPAAAITIIVSQLYGLGRVDIGAYLAGYILIFTTFLTGFNLKMDQAFELASSWVYNKVPRVLRAHPHAQKYINGQLQKRKILYGYFENLWGIIVQENIAGSMLTLKDNVQYGTRAFLRLVFGGDTPTEIVVRFVDSMSQALQGIPGAQTALDGLKKLVSHNFEAFERFPDRLPIVEGIPQVTENPNLPRHRTGEFLGKTLGAVATWGGLTAVPYVVTDIMQRFRERGIQKKGDEILQNATASKETADSVDETATEERPDSPAPMQVLRCQELFATSL